MIHTILKKGVQLMQKELELAKKLAVLGWMRRHHMISDDEYSRAKTSIMKTYQVVSFMTA